MPAGIGGLPRRIPADAGMSDNTEAGVPPGATRPGATGKRPAAALRTSELRKPSQIDRRNELLAVAARLFAYRGFAGTSMDGVARELGIQKASLYYWVDSKETLLYLVMQDALAELRATAEAIAKRPDVPFGAKLHDLISLNCQFMISHPDVMGVFFREAKWLSGARGRELRDTRISYSRLHEDVFTEALDRGEIQLPRAQIPVYVNIMFSITSNLPVWYRSAGALSRFEIAALVANMLIGPLLGEPTQSPPQTPALYHEPGRRASRSG